MDKHARLAMESLPRLSASSNSVATCKICSAAAPAFDVVDLNKICSEIDPYQFELSGIPVYYHRCIKCKFMFTSFFDTWSNEDFATFIYNEDYIKVDGDYLEERPKRDSVFFIHLLKDFAGLSVLDYGGGSGILARELRAHGIDAENYDPFSCPARPKRSFDVITCMEVIEHSTDPVSTLRDMGSLLSDGGCIFVGTGVQPLDIERIRASWWYVGPRNGHVSLQAATSLSPLARAAGLTAYRTGYLHGFCAKPSAISEQLLSRIGRPAVDILLSAPATDEVVGPGLSTALAQWQDLEDGWRWTRQSEIVWRWKPPHDECDVRIDMRFAMEIFGGFVAGSALYIGEQEFALTVGKQEVTAAAIVRSAAEVTIRLSTPAPVRPIDLYGTADTRHLGVAVRTARDDFGVE